LFFAATHRFADHFAPDTDPPNVLLTTYYLLLTTYYLLLTTYYFAPDSDPPNVVVLGLGLG
jgi:hypothetical protein